MATKRRPTIIEITGLLKNGAASTSVQTPLHTRIIPIIPIRENINLWCSLNLFISLKELPKEDLGFLAILLYYTQPKKMARVLRGGKSG